MSRSALRSGIVLCSVLVVSAGCEGDDGGQQGGAGNRAGGRGGSVGGATSGGNVNAAGKGGARTGGANGTGGSSTAATAGVGDAGAGAGGSEIAGAGGTSSGSGGEPGGDAGVGGEAGTLVLDPAGDEDGDGLTNGDELRLSTDPQGWDSDDDGFTDPDEVGDPDEPRDTDGDLVIDALECELNDNGGGDATDTTDPADGWQVAAGRFYPRVIANDGVEDTRVEVRMTGAGITRVALRTPSNFYDAEVLPDELIVGGQALGDDALELFDDGTHGDRFAGDNLWSRGGITTSMAIRTPTGGRGWVLFTDLLVTDGAGSEVLTFAVDSGPDVQPGMGYYLGVIEAAEVVEPKTITPTLQRTPHLINLVEPETCVRFRRQLVDDPSVYASVPGLFKPVLDVIPGDVDFVALVADRPARGTWSGVHLRASVTAAGTGLTTYAADSRWGSEGSFKTGIVLDFAVHVPLNHELTHYWGAYLSPALGFDWDGSHWGVASTFGVLGGFDPDSFIDNADGTYGIDYFSTNGNDWRTTTLSPIELYLAGLAPASEVEPIITMQDAVPVGNTDTQVIVEGTPKITPIEDIIAVHGERVPTYADAQKAFSLAFAVYTERPLTPSEMSWLDLLADFYGRESVAGTMTFEAATLGRATMETTVPTLVGEAP
jgi:hypothetical protein